MAVVTFVVCGLVALPLGRAVGRRAPKCALRRLDVFCLVVDQAMVITIAPTCSLRPNIS
jgi:hypothetical protein